MMRSMPPAIKTQITARIEQAKYPRDLPVRGRLLVDREGNIWVQEVQRSPGDEAQRFAVVRLVGAAAGAGDDAGGFPRSRPSATEVVYGVWKDADDVQHVRRLPAPKGAVIPS